MDALDEIAYICYEISDYFYDAYYLIEDIPLLSDTLGTLLLWGGVGFWNLGYYFESVSRWADGVIERLGEILSWDKIKELIEETFNLSEWISSFKASLEEIIEKMKAFLSWDEIAQKAKETWTILAYTPQTILEEIFPTLREELLSFFEAKAEDMVDLAGRILAKVW